MVHTHNRGVYGDVNIEESVCYHSETNYATTTVKL